MLKATPHNRIFGLIALVSFISQSLFLSVDAKAQSYGDLKFKQCAKNATTLRNHEHILHGKSVKIELRYAESCKTRWVKAEVPVGAMIFLEDSKGNVYANYKAQRTRQGDHIMVEAVSDMVSVDRELRACTQHPNPRSLYDMIRKKESSLPKNPNSGDLENLRNKYCTPLG